MLEEFEFETCFAWGGEEELEFETAFAWGREFKDCNERISRAHNSLARTKDSKVNIRNITTLGTSHRDEPISLAGSQTIFGLEDNSSPLMTLFL